PFHGRGGWLIPVRFLVLEATGVGLGADHAAVEKDVVAWSRASGRNRADLGLGRDLHFDRARVVAYQVLGRSPPWRHPVHVGRGGLGRVVPPLERLHWVLIERNGGAGLEPLVLELEAFDAA